MRELENKRIILFKYYIIILCIEKKRKDVKRKEIKQKKSFNYKKVRQNKI